MIERVLPIALGDWVAPLRDGPISVGRVKQSYWGDDGEVLMDVVLYFHTGVLVGRDSPPEGGPKTFEPAIVFDDLWTRIEKPQFPLRIAEFARPSTSGMVTLHYGVFHDAHGAAKPKAVRTKVRKQSRDYMRSASVIFVPGEPSNQIDLEIAGLRRAAQELRDTARMLTTDAGALLRSRASSLEQEAARLAAKD